MAILVFKDAYVNLNTVDLSDHVRSVTIDYGATLQDKTAMGATTSGSIAGLLDWTINIEFLQDYAAGEVDATLFPLVGAAEFAFIIKPNGDTTSATNPKFTGNAVIENYQPLGGSVGDLAMAPVTLRPGTAIARATSD